MRASRIGELVSNPCLCAGVRATRRLPELPLTWVQWLPRASLGIHEGEALGRSGRKSWQSSPSRTSQVVYEWANLDASVPYAVLRGTETRMMSCARGLRRPGCQGHGIASNTILARHHVAMLHMIHRRISALREER